MTFLIILVVGFLVYKNRDRLKGMLSPSLPQPPPMYPGPYHSPVDPNECPTCHQPLGQVHTS